MSPSSPSAQTLSTDPRLCAAMPLVYVAWSDGLLTHDEIDGVWSTLTDEKWLDDDARQRLMSWLDPDRPPTPVELKRLLEAINAYGAKLSALERRTLADLGLRIAEVEHDVSAKEFESGQVHDALLKVEQALGIASQEAVHALLDHAPWPVRDTFAETEAPFSRPTLTKLIDGDHHQAWQRVRELLSGDGFVLRDDDDTSTRRADVRRWLGKLAEAGLGALALPERYGGQHDKRAFIASFEALGLFDLSLAVKFGVQFGLFGGSVQELGTPELHDRVLAEIGRGRTLGGFAMTELGHGSNVREIETTARYDAKRGVFVLDTPSESARKEWIGNAGQDGRFMTVFAQLEVGGQHHGVHAFLVRIREDDGSPVEGVRTEDCGRKMGLNGVDNGRLWFTNVEVPRDNLLARFGHVDASGNYSSPITSSSKRFFTMLGTLVAGRISVGACANTAAKVALAVAVRYGALRRQFGPPGKGEISILDYREHQLRLFPRLAAVVANGFAVQELARRFCESEHEDNREVETLAAALKAQATRNAIETIQVCRECCGGMGFLTTNRISTLRRDVDVFATFEGDNTVLLQLAAKSLLTDFRQQLSDDAVTTTLSLLGRRAAATLRYKNPLGARRTERSHLEDPAFHQHALAYREEQLLVAAARRIKRRVDEGMNAFEAFNDIQDHLLALARAFAERVTVEQFARHVEKAEQGPERDALQKLYVLYCLLRIREDMAFFAENGYVENNKARAIRKLIVTLCQELRPMAVPLVDALGVPDSCLSPIAFEGYVTSSAL